ncbi:MAG: twin-arginine translocase TatA/TatE family subunit [Proteocatella sp.]
MKLIEKIDVQKRKWIRMFNFSMPELILTLVVALIVFGPGKLPEVGKAIGKGIQEFRRASTVNLNEVKEEIKTATYMGTENKLNEKDI